MYPSFPQGASPHFQEARYLSPPRGVISLIITGQQCTALLGRGHVHAALPQTGGLVIDLGLGG